MGCPGKDCCPRCLALVHSTRRTPHVAILALAAIVSILAFSGDISELASATSLLLLLVFALMNTALIVLKLRKGEPAGRFEVPLFGAVSGLSDLCRPDRLAGDHSGSRNARSAHRGNPPRGNCGALLSSSGRASRFPWRIETLAHLP